MGRIQAAPFRSIGLERGHEFRSSTQVRYSIIQNGGAGFRIELVRSCFSSGRLKLGGRVRKLAMCIVATFAVGLVTPHAEAAKTKGDVRVLCIRVNFKDKKGAPSDRAVRGRMRSAKWGLREILLRKT